MDMVFQSSLEYIYVVKLYSRNQVIFFICASALLSASIVIGIDTVRDNRQPRHLNAEELDAFQPAVVGDLLPTQAGGNYDDDELENIRIYEQLNEAVVNITTEIIARNWFFDPVPQEGGTGSGSIIDKSGYILTNYHIIEGTYKLYITLADGSQFEGQIVGKDPENDLAIIKFDPGDKDLVAIPFGRSSDLKVGQKVLAIGNPFAFERTLTTGIISGLGRPVRTSNQYVIQGMIQTDASINPGNSGGPLLNSKGEMIGINTVIYSPSGGSVGIGFASPIDTARRVIPELFEFGEVRRGWIDVIPFQLIPRIVSIAKLKVNKGILVSEVAAGGNAEAAGIRGGTDNAAVRYGRSIIYLDGDVIVEINGEKIESISDMFGALENTKPGQMASVVVHRDGKNSAVEVKLSERSDSLGL